MKTPYPSKEEIKEIAIKCGISDCGIVSAEQSIAEYARYLECTENLPPELAYLRRPWDKRERLSLWDPRAKSAIVCAFPYWDRNRDYAAEMAAINAGEGAASYLERTGRQNLQYGLLNRPDAKISRYALSPDYHKWVKEKLRMIRDLLKKTNPTICGSVFCDTSPVMEKELAWLAGLGFRGRNSLIISPKFGSWFHIGGLTLNFYIEPDNPINLPLFPQDNSDGKKEYGCGNCHVCEKICPQKALSDGKVNQSRCSSYLNTQVKTQLSPNVILPYSYGCDLCQEHCPYNKQMGRHHC